MRMTTVLHIGFGRLDYEFVIGIGRTHAGSTFPPEPSETQEGRGLFNLGGETPSPHVAGYGCILLLPVESNDDIVWQEIWDTKQESGGA